jgi:translocation and assembly module TamA
VSAAAQGPQRQRAAGRYAALILGAQLAVAGCGPKGPHGPWVHKIYLDGAKQVKAKDIRGKMLVQQSSWIPLSPKKYLDHALSAEVDRERIATYYRTRGYYAAEVPKVEVTPYKTDSSKPKDDPKAVEAVDIHYTVVEGQPVKIAQINIEGLEGIGEDGQHAVKKLELKPGQLFEHEPYLLAKEKILQRLRRRGYAFAGFIVSEAAVDRTALTAELTWVIDPGPKVVLGAVTVEGTSDVDPEALKKHAGIPTGERYSPEILDSVQGKLYNLGLFTAVNVEPVPDPDRPDVADVKITVTEGKFRELRLGVGVGIESLRTEVHGEMVFTQRRFLGGLRVLQLTLKPGYAALPAVWANPIYRHGPMLLAKAEFTQPDLIGTDSALTLALTYNLGIEYAYQYHGPEGRVGLTRGFWKDRIRLAAAYDFQFLDFFNIDPSINNIGESGSLFGFVDPYRLGYLQELVSLDLRNRAVDARSGFFLSFLFEHGGVYTGSAFEYQKLMPEVRGYIPIGERVTIAARIQFGQMFTQGDLGSPITERFYLGGPNSHRGFTYNRLSYQVCSGTPLTGVPIPQKLDCEKAEMDKSAIGDFRRIPVGGDQMLLGQLELRVALFKLAKNWVSLVAFSDAGDVAAPRNACPTGKCDAVPYSDHIDLTRLHVAVGGGLRYKTVIGTVRFDLGVRLNRLSLKEADGYENPDPDQRIAYHISIGEAF